MLRIRKRLSTLFLAVLLLNLSIKLDPINIDLSDSLCSVSGSISQNYTIHAPIVINSDGELAAVSNSGNGTAIDPYIISGWNITDSPSEGIYITGTTNHFRIVNCWIESSNKNGIFVNSVSTGTTTIANNTCESNGYSGIYLEYSNSSTIVNNTCNKNKDHSGIFILGSGSSTIANNTCNNFNFGIYIHSSSSSTIFNNTCNNNNEGIYLDDSNSSTIVNNTVESNEVGGISISQSEPGSGFSTIANNTCKLNGHGITLLGSNCNIIRNVLFNNENYGIFIFGQGPGDSENNVIHHNSFISNGQAGSQAYDEGINNQWYDETSLEGNSWSDYDGTGSYPIAGSARASDPFPSNTNGYEEPTHEEHIPIPPGTTEVEISDENIVISFNVSDNVNVSIQILDITEVPEIPTTHESLSDVFINITISEPELLTGLWINVSFDELGDHDPANAKIYYYDEVSQQWEEVTKTDVDYDLEIVWGFIDHVTIFGVMKKKAQPGVNLLDVFLILALAGIVCGVTFVIYSKAKGRKK